MRKKYIFLTAFLIAFLISLFSSCTKAPEEKNKAEASSTETLQENRSSQKRQRGRRGTQLAEIAQPGQGQMKREGHALKNNDVVVLSEAEKETIEIATVKAFYKPIASQLSAMGKVLANQYRKAIVSYPFPARVGQIHVKIGYWVKAGQKLVTLQSEEVGKAKSEFYKAQSDYELAKVNFEREKNLFERGVGAKKNYLATEAQLKVAEANLNAAEKKLHVLGFTEDQVKAIVQTHQINPIITLFAPISGKIIKNNAVLGAMVDQSTEILTIMDPSLLWIDAEIYEKDISEIRKGQKVEVSVPAYPGEIFMGKISFISDVLNEQTRTITVRTEVENRGYKLKPGMFANIKIFLNHKSRALALPKEAVLDEKDNKIVFIKKDGKYFLRIVKVGAVENNLVEILSGLQEGDEVVTKGNFQLKSKLYEHILRGGHVH